MRRIVSVCTLLLLAAVSVQKEEGGNFNKFPENSGVFYGNKFCLSIRCRRLESAASALRTYSRRRRPLVTISQLPCFCPCNFYTTHDWGCALWPAFSRHTNMATATAATTAAAATSRDPHKAHSSQKLSTSRCSHNSHLSLSLGYCSRIFWTHAATTADGRQCGSEKGRITKLD